MPGVNVDERGKTATTRIFIRAGQQLLKVSSRRTRYESEIVSEKGWDVRDRKKVEIQKEWYRICSLICTRLQGEASGRPSGLRWLWFGCSTIPPPADLPNFPNRTWQTMNKRELEIKLNVHWNITAPLANNAKWHNDLTNKRRQGDETGEANEMVDGCLFIKCGRRTWANWPFST